MDKNIAQNPPKEPVSYTRPNNSSPKFFDKFFSFFTKKTTAVLVILVLIIGVGAATIAVQRSTETRQHAATSLIPGCGSLGDVNGDGQINPIDSELILQYSAGYTVPNFIKANADLNGDGQVNPQDSTLILQYVAGFIHTSPVFPACSSSPSPTPTTTAIPNCDTGPLNCGLCTSNTNTCNGNGTRTCDINLLKSSSGTSTICNPVITHDNPCTLTPSNSNCVANGGPTATPAPTGTGGSPTSTPNPQPTIPAGNTVFALVVGLDGLGTTGDNGGLNGTRSVPTPPYNIPKRPTRNVIVELFQSSNGQQVGTAKTGTVTYANGVFTGSVNLGGVASGSYNIKVKSDGYLRRQVLGFNLTAGVSTLPPISLVVGDINGDNRISIQDYNILISCSSESTDNHGACGQYTALSDLDDNGAIEVAFPGLDYNLFLREFSVQNGD